LAGALLAAGAAAAAAVGALLLLPQLLSAAGGAEDPQPPDVLASLPVLAPQVSGVLVVVPLQPLPAALLPAWLFQESPPLQQKCRE
jgi:hypothetical protein